MRNRREHLRLEAAYLYRALVGKDSAPDLLLERYTAAQEHCFPLGDGDRAMELLMARRLNFGAIEFYLRLRSRGPTALTSKALTLLYLLEAESAWASLFYNRRSSRIRAALSLIGSASRCGYQVLIGAAQTHLHHVRV